MENLTTGKKEDPIPLLKIDDYLFVDMWGNWRIENWRYACTGHVFQKYQKENNINYLVKFEVGPKF